MRKELFEFFMKYHQNNSQKASQRQKADGLREWQFKGRTKDVATESPQFNTACTRYLGDCLVVLH